jgi:site-specific recombinase XerD
VTTPPTAGKVRQLIDRLEAAEQDLAGIRRARLWAVWSGGWAAAGLRPGQRPLSLKATRKTYASRLMMAGVPTRTIQLLLGHTKLTSTEAYLPVDLNMMATGVALMTKHLDRM